MGFNLTTTDGGNQLPAYLQELGGYQDEGLSAGIAPRAPKIGISIDKHFTVTREGQTTVLETIMTDNAGNKHAVPVQSMRIIIVAASQTLTKAWYEKAYVPGSTEAPECYSNDGKVPAPGVAKPQCANCAQCPKNAFGSNPTTGRGKACADRKMVVCVWEGAPDELMTWNVSTTSLQSLAKFDTELRNANIPMQSVLVELAFDPGITYPVVKINALGFVDKETTMRLKEASQSAEVASLLREVDYEPAQAQQSPVPQNQIQFGQQTQQAAPEQTQQQQAPVNEAPKRTRRTKAQIEADRLAAAQAPQQTVVEPEQANTVQVDEAQESAPVNDVVAQLQAQLAAALAAQQKPNPEVTQVVQRQPDPTPEPQQTQQAQVVQPSGNVAALLGAWANKKQ